MMADRSRLSDEQLVSNARGLALASFADPATIERLLGCDRAEASAFQEQAAHDFADLKIRVAQAKRGGQP